MILLKNCNLVSELVEGYDKSEADILIDGKTIIGIGSYAAEKGMEVYDLDGATVLPGFMDLHAHLEESNGDYEAEQHRTPYEFLLDCFRYDKAYLRHGYTTIRDVGNSHYDSIAVRTAVEEGTFHGARVISAGSILSPTAVGNRSFESMYSEFDDPRDALHFVRRDIQNGASFIKYMVTGAVLNKGGVPGEIIATPEEIKAVVDAAKMFHTYVAAHCHGTEGIRQAILNGVRTIEHASYLDDACIDLILEKKDEVAIIPTMSVAYSICKGFDGSVHNEFTEKALDGLKHMLSGSKHAYDRGVMVGWGTDTDRTHFEAHPDLEFVARKEAGYTNVQLLKQATIDSARIIGWDDRIGTVKVGKLADLVVYKDDPSKDLAALKALPLHVFSEGRRFVD